MPMMKSIVAKQFFIWTPRVTGILFALFLSIFALDVFGAGYEIGETMLALFMHLLPVFVLAIAVAIAWRWQWVGALLFAGFGIWYLVTSWGIFPISVYLIIVGPSFTIAGLYLFNWHYRSELQLQR